MKALTQKDLVYIGLTVGAFVVLSGGLTNAFNNVNPNSPSNFVNRAVSNVSGNLAETLNIPRSFSDSLLIARFMLINPFASEESRQMAANLLEAERLRNPNNDF